MPTGGTWGVRVGRIKEGAKVLGPKQLKGWRSCHQLSWLSLKKEQEQHLEILFEMPIRQKKRAVEQATTYVNLRFRSKIQEGYKSGRHSNIDGV